MSVERRIMREGANQAAKQIVIEESIFEFVDVQRDGDSAIYKNANSYLRIGKPEKVMKDLALHKQMETNGFPVARIISEGEFDGHAYFIESSLGDKHFGTLFADDIETTGAIRQETFQKLLDVTEKFARAQLRTQTNTRDFNEFAQGIHLDILCEELPEYADRINSLFGEVKNRIEQLPFVVTHGDFNPNNLYPEGAIDLEDSFHGPFGHDVIGGLIHIDYFPDPGDCEFFARYRFSSDQKSQYLNHLDRICVDENIPPLSDFLDDFEFTRGVWLLVRLDRHRKLQKFRYDKFIAKFLA